MLVQIARKTYQQMLSRLFMHL